MPLAADSLTALGAICDTLLPVEPSRWRDSVAPRIADALARAADPGDLARLTGLLRLMQTRAGLLLVAGRLGPFDSLPRADREAALRAMARHPAPPLRAAFQVLKRLAATFYYGDTGDDGLNPAWRAMEYPGPLPFAPAPRSGIQPLAMARDTALTCDVVVVGSGAGGGVIAGELASAGFDVVVVEKGALVEPPEFTHRELSSFRRLYLDAAMRTTRDRGMIVLAGSCLGGGTVVNYTTSLRLPDAVREEWTRASGLNLFVGDAFSESMDEVCRRLSVNLDHSRPSRRDTLLARGLEALGWHVAPVPRNVAGCAQDDLCGYCGLGCVRNAKQSMLATYLTDAWSHAARFVVDCAVDAVTIDRGRATGVTGRTRAGHRVAITAREVVVAAGALHSPALLRRSGVRGPVGEHLRLHPVAGVWGLFDEPVRPWTGTLQACYSEQFADLDRGYGVRFETAPVHPVFYALAMPWEGAGAFEARMRQLVRTSLVGVLLRDRFGGRVRADRRGGPIVEYRLSRYDQRHLRVGIEAAARVLVAAGATRVLTSHETPVTLDPPQPVEDWLREVDRAGYGPHDLTLASFHQMGTCRMGRDPAASVVSASGECHGVRRLSVADASLFPTASGVNPMITIAALAHRVAQAIKSRL